MSGVNDEDAVLGEIAERIISELGADVPMHFTAFHPDWKLRDVPATPSDTLTRARAIALENGVRFAYTGNVHDKTGGSTYCPGCGRPLAVTRKPGDDQHRPGPADGRCGDHRPGQ